MILSSMSPEEFIAEAGEREGELATLDALVREIAPELHRDVQGTFLVYGPFRYRYASGREGDWARIALAPRKGGITVHLACGVGAPVRGANPGVGCLKIRDLAKVDLEALRREIARAAVAPLPQEKTTE